MHTDVAIQGDMPKHRGKYGILQNHFASIIGLRTYGNWLFYI